MAPTPDDFSEQINRPLQPGDLLVKFVEGANVYFEVIETGVLYKPNKLDRFFGEKESEGIKIREITPFGHVEGGSIVTLDKYDYDEIILVENRKDDYSPWKER